MSANNTTIHETAVVSDQAKIGSNVNIGPYCIVGPDVTIADNVTLRAHVNIDTICEIGEGTEIFPFVSISDPQDLKYHGEKSKVVIGKNTIIREHATINPGTEADKMITKVGDNCLLMIGVHVAHDCTVGNRVIMANNATLAGHVEVGDYAIIGGLSAVRQKVKIGHNAMIGGLTGVENDVIPYGLVMGERGHLAGLNLVGLERAGLPREEVAKLREAYKVIFEKEDDVLAQRIRKAAEMAEQAETVDRLISFLDAPRGYGLCQPARSA